MFLETYFHDQYKLTNLIWPRSILQDFYFPWTIFGRKRVLSEKYFVENVFQNMFPKEYFSVKYVSNKILFR